MPGSRGVCGAMIQKGAAKFCVWGLHPIQNNNNVRHLLVSFDRLAGLQQRISWNEPYKPFFVVSFEGTPVFIPSFPTESTQHQQG